MQTGDLEPPVGTSFNPKSDRLSTALPTRSQIWRRGLLLALAAMVLYLLAPALIEIYSKVGDLKDIRFRWLFLMVLLMGGSLASTWMLIRTALPEASLFVVSHSQLAANAFSRVVPGSAAAGGALQYRMLSRAGVDTAAAGAALTAVSLITTGVTLAMPVATIPTFVGGAAIPGQLARAAWLAVIIFFVLALIFWLFLKSARAPRLVAGAVVPILRRVKRDPTAGSDLADRLEEERDAVAIELGTGWKTALGASVLNRTLEYLVLLTALHAVRAEPGWAVYLLAYVAATVLAMIPITPGGLGFVEAGLTSMLTIAGVPFETAALATLAFRFVNFWLPLPVGLIAYWNFNRRVAA